jgi:hypothetical protein
MPYVFDGANRSYSYEESPQQSSPQSIGDNNSSLCDLLQNIYKDPFGREISVFISKCTDEIDGN